MRTILFFFSFSLYCLSYHCQTVMSSCTAPDSIVKRYKKSADKMAIRRVNYIGDSYKDSVAINRQISSQYLKALFGNIK